jgi:hypothetical protein
MQRRRNCVLAATVGLAVLITASAALAATISFGKPVRIDSR